MTASHVGASGHSGAGPGKPSTRVQYSCAASGCSCHQSRSGGMSCVEMVATERYGFFSARPKRTHGSLGMRSISKERISSCSSTPLTEAGTIPRSSAQGSIAVLPTTGGSFFNASSRQKSLCRT